MPVDLLASARLIGREHRPHREHVGPRVELITEQGSARTAPGVLRGTVNPEVVVPMHSHADPETFCLLEGELDGLTFDADGAPAWIRFAAGEAPHVPPNARHALRNVTDARAVALVISTPDLIDFFEQTGRPIPSGDAQLDPAPPHLVEEFGAECVRRDHWLASPEENAAIGIRLHAPS